MPELPEVETVRRGLDNFIRNVKIKKVEILCDKSFIGDKKLVENQEIIKFRRRGKALLIDLKNGMTMMVHLRMTGQLIYDGEERYAAGHPSENFVDKLPNKQTRVVFELDNGILYFNDQRKFGFIKVLKTKEVENDNFIKKLAKEPWEADLADFYEKLQRHKNSPVKAVILDQTIICGLGNIYADESLFMSKIHPAEKAGNLTQKQAANLLNSARTVMEKSIASGGSTMKDYVKADGTRGDYLDKFAQVFNRTGEPCPVCGAEIKKIRVAGRGTHFCPNCQHRRVTDLQGAPRDVLTGDRRSGRTRRGREL